MLNRRRTLHTQNGMTLVELMIALAVLVIGLGAVMVMITTAVAANNGSKHDTNGTMLAQLVAEQIGSIPASNSPVLTVTDCSNQVRNVATAGAAGPNGAGARLDANGNIDWTQSTAGVGGVPLNYWMRFVACGAGGAAQTYEVRWNVTTLFQTPVVPGGPAVTFTKLVTASARRRDQPGAATRAAGLNQIGFGIPVTIRTVVGN
jgi:prepilin-type N-terminal cleavage/methylation domain-containing protein